MEPAKSSAAAGSPLREKLSIFLVLLLLGGLPASAWLDARNLTAEITEKQAAEVNAALTSIRGYYSNNIVSRVLAVNGNAVKPTHDYESTPAHRTASSEKSSRA